MYVLALAKWTKRYMDPTADTICGRSRNFKIELIIIRSLTLDIMTINDLWLRDIKTVTTASLKFLWLPVGLFWCTCEDKSWPRVLDLWFFWTFLVSSRQVLYMDSAHHQVQREYDHSFISYVSFCTRKPWSSLQNVYRFCTSSTLLPSLKFIRLPVVAHFVGTLCNHATFTFDL